LSADRSVLMASPTRTSAAPSRRSFLQSSAATVAASTLTSAAAVNAHAGGTDVLRVGLIGCGNRGTGAAEQALSADPNVKLVAMGDAFPERIDRCLQTLRRGLGRDYESK